MAVWELEEQSGVVVTDHKHLAYKPEVFVLCSFKTENVLACVGVKRGLPGCVCFRKINVSCSEI